MTVGCFHFSVFNSSLIQILAPKHVTECGERERVHRRKEVGCQKPPEILVRSQIPQMTVWKMLQYCLLGASSSAFLEAKNQDFFLFFFLKPLLFIYFKKLFIYLFLAVLGLCYWAGFFSSCGKWGLLSSLGALTYCRGLSCSETQALGCEGFHSCGLQAQ